MDKPSPAKDQKTPPSRIPKRSQPGSMRNKTLTYVERHRQNQKLTSSGQTGTQPLSATTVDVLERNPLTTTTTKSDAATTSSPGKEETNKERSARYQIEASMMAEELRCLYRNQAFLSSIKGNEANKAGKDSSPLEMGIGEPAVAVLEHEFNNGNDPISEDRPTEEPQLLAKIARILEDRHAEEPKPKPVVKNANARTLKDRPATEEPKLLAKNVHISEDRHAEEPKPVNKAKPLTLENLPNAQLDSLMPLIEEISKRLLKEKADTQEKLASSSRSLANEPIPEEPSPSSVRPSPQKKIIQEAVQEDEVCDEEIEFISWSSQKDEIPAVEVEDVEEEIVMLDKSSGTWLIGDGGSSRHSGLHVGKKELSYRAANSLPSILVPEILTLEKSGDFYKGVLKIENPTNIFLACKISSNKCAKGRYSATPNFICIPPKGFVESVIATQENWYSEYLGKGDKLFVRGNGSPRFLDQDELQSFLNAMGSSYPEVGCKAKISLKIMEFPSFTSIQEKDEILTKEQNARADKALATEVSIWTQTLRETNLHLREALSTTQDYIRLAYVASFCIVMLLGVWLVHPLMTYEGEELVFQPAYQHHPDVENLGRYFPLYFLWENIFGKF